MLVRSEILKLILLTTCLLIFFMVYMVVLCDAYKEKKYVCLFCLENNYIENSEKLIPLPSLEVQNELKINSCKKKSKLLLKEIDKIQSFLERYQKNFEKENKAKIEELFKYIYKIVDYNHTTALTLYEQCKNEQKNIIDKKLKELIILR